MISIATATTTLRLQPTEPTPCRFCTTTETATSTNARTFGWRATRAETQTGTSTPTSSRWKWVNSRATTPLTSSFTRRTTRSRPTTKTYPPVNPVTSPSSKTTDVTTEIGPSEPGLPTFGCGTWLLAMRTKTATTTSTCSNWKRTSLARTSSRTEAPSRPQHRAHQPSSVFRRSTTTRRSKSGTSGKPSPWAWAGRAPTTTSSCCEGTALTTARARPPTPETPTTSPSWSIPAPVFQARQVPTLLTSQPDHRTPPSFSLESSVPEPLTSPMWAATATSTPSP